MGEEKKDEKKDPPELEVLSAEYFGLPIYAWLILVIAVIGLVIAIYGVSRRR